MTDNEDLFHVESRSDLLDYKDCRLRDPHHRCQFVKLQSWYGALGSIAFASHVFRIPDYQRD